MKRGLALSVGGLLLVFLILAALSVAIAPRTTLAESRAVPRPVVLFVQGAAGAGAERTLLVPLVCYKPAVGLVSAATSDCLSLLPRETQVSLDSGTIVRVSARETARCTDEDGKPTGESRASLAVSGQPGRFSFAVWPSSARSLIKSVSQSPQSRDVPLGELDSVAKLVSQYAHREIDVLQRLKADLDGDGKVDVAYSVDARCTKEEMRARGGDTDCEPWSCFNGLVVRWGGSTTFSVVTQDWDLGQIAAVSDLDGDRRPEVLVFAPLDEGLRIQVFTVDKRRLSPLEPWCCGCAKKKARDAVHP
jgi:hypothetical protein